MRRQEDVISVLQFLEVQWSILDKPWHYGYEARSRFVNASKLRVVRGPGSDVEISGKTSRGRKSLCVGALVSPDRRLIDFGQTTHVEAG